ncbi:hypothetical protein PAXRUDRAFT_829760 [Paxillus rubicundulus Ve08.2h10]|uniref:Uncharacterized protein n=1 Tax=Paxillus rubicundulus Ve08.2h10 TaxID=930991 RepID=A0A0D0DZN0_9AGAM|nr:hypothetical protein PAXRUDRAFT_829760 [Paxillus rubicundulus Ve08.2h10]
MSGSRGKTSSCEGKEATRASGEGGQKAGVDQEKKDLRPKRHSCRSPREPLIASPMPPPCPRPQPRLVQPQGPISPLSLIPSNAIKST